MAQDRSKEDWHLNKGVPISLIVVLLVQTSGMVWWASSMDSRVGSIENTIAETEKNFASENLRQWTRINSAEKAAESVASNSLVTSAVLSRLETRVESLAQELRETNKLLRERYAE